MTLLIYFDNLCINNIVDASDIPALRKSVSQQYGVSVSDFYITINGKRAPEDYNLCEDNCLVRINSKLVGGKGGFGSMLRAIGAQIEKTTNREACRDLSGRRLRDINEEKRLRKWLEGQSDRDKEAAERKQKKLERLMSEPKISVNLNDPVYEKERQDLPERVSAAVDAGWEASTSESSLKRKLTDKPQGKGKKKTKLWIDAELSDCLSSDDEHEDDDGDDKAPSTAISTDSGNESDLTAEASNK